MQKIKLPTDKKIIDKARELHPRSKPMYYFDEGQRIGFIEGCKWMRSELIKTKQMNKFEILSRLRDIKFYVATGMPCVAEIEKIIINIENELNLNKGNEKINLHTK